MRSGEAKAHVDAAEDIFMIANRDEGVVLVVVKRMQFKVL
jgi:hypothetical protein